MTKERFVAEIEQGALYVGSPETVASKIARAIYGLGVQRFDLKYPTGGRRVRLGAFGPKPPLASVPTTAVRKGKPSFCKRCSKLAREWP